VNPPLSARLRLLLAQPDSQPSLAGDQPGAPQDGIAAAVLIGITDRTSPGILLTVRREHLRAHAGQIAFPGGRVDQGESAEDASIREAGEELGIPGRLVEVVGWLSEYRTITGYRVTPVVGIIPPDLPLRPHDAEVADWFEAPLDFLLDRSNQHQKSAVFAGHERHYWEIMWNGRRIWGATAAILVNLSRRLQWNG
jgi:8-oxo-dGTP pyrophosphatase MutT (NUDIX family)